MKKYINSASKTSSIQKSKREGEYSVLRYSSIPRLRTSGSMGGVSNIPVSVRKQRPSAQASYFNHASKLHPLLQRVSITEKRCTKDTRPLSEKWYMLKCVQQVQEFLVEKNYSFPHGIKILSNPTTKSFFHIFEFMYRWLDPSYTTTEKPEEIIYILKLLNYPFINNIKRSQLIVVGPQSWPNLLGVITWMIPLIQYVEKCDIQAFINDTESEDCFILHEQIPRNYYVFITTGEAIYDKYDHLAEKIYGNSEILSSLLHEKEEFENESRELEEEIEKFNELYVLKERTKADITCIANYIEEMTNLINQKEKDIEELEEIEKKTKLEEEQLRSEVSSFEKIYHDQEISTQSVEYVNAQKNYLTKKVDENKDLMEEAKKTLWDEEMAIASQIEETRNKYSEFNKIYQKSKIELKNTYKMELPEFEFNPSANSQHFDMWIDTVIPKFRNIETNVKDVIVKNEKILLEQQNSQKELTMKNAELNLFLQVAETKLEQQKKLQDARRQEMKNEISNLFLQYEDLNNKAVKSYHQDTQEQQQLSDQIRILEKQKDILLENNRKDEAEASHSLIELMQKTREYIKKLKAIEAKIIQKYEDAQKKTITFFNDTV